MPPKSEPSPNDGWLQQRYAAYYRRHPPQLPDRFGKREYAFLFFGQKSMLRHLAFGKRHEFEGFHAQEGPAHSYYSTAYYQRPDAPTMAEKGWMAAELIFDLDADHVPGSEKLPYPKQLELVKKHFLRLVDDFILKDFGFAEKDLLLTFSGGRGYHCHVLDEKALELTSQERREIVDYITQTGLDLERIGFRSVPVARKSNAGPSTGRFDQPSYSFRVPPADSPGWGGKINDALVEFVNGCKTLTLDAFVQEFREIAVKTQKGTMRRLKANELAELHRQIERLDVQRIREGFFDMGTEMRSAAPSLLQAKAIALKKGETDEPVTSDTKRLIRTPGSLHGKTGLRVTVLRRDQVDAFDPLTDAVAFGAEPVEVEMTRSMTVSLMGETLKLEPGRARLPEFAAVFCCLLNGARPATSR